MTSKSKLLGTGASFAHTQNVSARRQAINAATKAPTEGAPPPVQLPVDVISLNPANPRSTLGDLTDLAASLRDHGQKTAISIMSRFAYLEANPDVEDQLEGGTKYVAIDGNSRLAAAREAGLATIKVMLDEDLGSNPDEVLESALVANVHRADLDPLDEARALHQLLTVHKTQEALAARLHRSQGWISQRLALLGLTPELKEKLVSGEEPAELLRRVGNKKPEEQAAHLEKLKAQKKPKATPPTPAPVPAHADSASTPTDDTDPSTGSPHYAVMKKAASSAAPAEAGTEAPTGTATLSPVPDPRSEPAPHARDHGTTESPTSGAGPIRMDWADGRASMAIAFQQWTGHLQRRQALAQYLELLGDPDKMAADLAAASSPAYRRELTKHLNDTL